MATRPQCSWPQCSTIQTWSSSWHHQSTDLTHVADTDTHWQDDDVTVQCIKCNDVTSTGLKHCSCATTWTSESPVNATSLSISMGGRKLSLIGQLHWQKSATSSDEMNYFHFEKFSHCPGKRGLQQTREVLFLATWISSLKTFQSLQSHGTKMETGTCPFVLLDSHQMRYLV